MSYLFASGQALLNQASDCYFSSNVFVRGVVTAVGLNLLYRSCEWIGNKAEEYLGIRLGPISHQARAIMGSWANVSVNPLLDRAAQYESGKAIDFYTRHVQRNARRYPRIEAFFRRCITNPIISSCLIGPVLEELAFRVAPNCLPPGLTRKIAVVASIIMFAYSHEPYAVDRVSGRYLALLAMGFAYTCIYQGEGLLAATLAHGGYNFLNWIV